MLKNQPWLRLAGDIMTEYEQCLMEGKDVSSYKPLCEAIAHGITDDDRRDIEDAIEVICDAMRAHPVRADYPYVEPSDYESPPRPPQSPLPFCPRCRKICRNTSRARGTVVSQAVCSASR